MSIVFYIGWIGSILYILAYFLLVRGTLSAQKNAYHILNALGGGCLIINGASLNDFPNIVVNSLWAAMAVFMIFKISRENRKKEPQSEISIFEP